MIGSGVFTYCNCVFKFTSVYHFKSLSGKRYTKVKLRLNVPPSVHF